MAYLTLAECFTYGDRATIAALLEPDLDVQLLQDVVDGADLSNWSTEEQTRAARAIERLSWQLEQITLQIKGYIGHRYKMPIPAYKVKKSVIPGIALDLLIFKLHESASGGERAKSIQLRYEAAISLLESIRDGVVDLPDIALLPTVTADDPASVPPAATPMVVPITPAQRFAQ